LMLAATGSACSTLMPAASFLHQATSSAPLGDSVTFDEKGMYAVEALYNVPAQAYVTADSRNLPGWQSVKPTVRPLMIEARQVLLAVREAYKTGDERSFGTRVARLRSLRDKVMALIPATH
jgi:hypothetical protein